MNKNIRCIVAISALCLASLPARAQSAPKILVVDIAKLFDSHWKSQEQNVKLQADASKAQEQASELQKQGNALVAEFKELDEQSKNPAATSDAKAKAQADAQKKYDEIQQKQAELKTFIQNAQSTLRQRSQSFKTMMIEEITKTAVEIARRRDATFLLDKSGPTLMGVSNILYSDPGLDITDEVLAAINKDRPATPASPSTAPASGASDAPKITLPGAVPAR